MNTISQPVSSFKQQQSIQKECIVISPTSSRASSSSQSNFKTFKTVALTSNNSPNHLVHSPNNSPYIKKQHVDYATLSYRTMPSHGLQHQSGTLNSRSNHQSKVVNNFDQKPLNLPVNELFKRYELKRHAADSTIATNVIGSMSSIHSSLGSLQFNQYQNNQMLKKINNNNNNINELNNAASPLINVNKLN